MPTKRQLTDLQWLCRWAVALVLMLAITPGWTASDELENQIRLDFAALRAAEDDFRESSETKPGSSAAEVADYAAYISRLKRRVYDGCQSMIRSGLAWPEEVPCPLITSPVTRSADISTQEEPTLEEQIAVLDKQLNAGLGEYDERLLQEQERIKAASPNDNPANNGAGTGGGEGYGDAGENTANASNDPHGQSGGEREVADNNTTRTTSRPADNSSGPTGKDRGPPEDIPDGSDDDVVARQLREAAEKETDPELKAKLWEEYRRYKRGTQ